MFAFRFKHNRIPLKDSKVFFIFQKVRNAGDYEKIINLPKRVPSITRLFCFGSLVILDVARCYLWLFTLYINIKIGKNSC